MVFRRKLIILPCTIKDLEKTENYCLRFEDSMDSLRLKADAIKGSLS